MRTEDDGTIVFSTGRRVRVYGGTIGLSPEMDVHEGYDGTIHRAEFEHVPDQDIDDEERGMLRRAERIELADHMIARWQEFKRRAEADQAKPVR